MHRFKIALISGVVLFSFQADIGAQESRSSSPDPARDYSWREAASKNRLNPNEIEQLAKDKILVTNEAFKQVFTPYLISDVPVFVTSDSLLNAFHVLYEESIMRFEQANSRKLGGILKFLWTKLQTADKAFTGKPQLVAAAKKRAKIVMATAMQLLGEQSTPLEPPLAAIVKEEAGRIEAAQGQQKPAWLGPPDRGFMALDYTRYRPRGFYTRTPSLQRYFRALSWLQSVPFRISNDEELVSFLMLRTCLTSPNFPCTARNIAWVEAIKEHARILECLVGPGDDLSLMTPIHVERSRTDLDDGGKVLEKLRGELLEEAKEQGWGSKINDQQAFPPDDPNRVAELSCRVLSACRIPDALLFQRTTDPRTFQRSFPNGLEVCAMLGSSFARSRLADQKQGTLLAEIDKCKNLFPTETLYTHYLDCLQMLLVKPEPDAPPFMSSTAWQIKSCQTVLSGWAQMRHTWTLQAKRNVIFLCSGDMPTGFVEPVPEFYSRLATLVEITQLVLKKAAALNTDPKEQAADIRAGVNLLEEYAKIQKDPNAAKQKQKDYSPQDLTQLERAYAIWDSLDASEYGEGAPDANARSAKMTETLRRLANDLERGQLRGDPLLAKAIQDSDPDIGDLWHCLGMICRRLEFLAYKQLQGASFTEDENRFLRSYGERLATVMLYRGNSYYNPHDDAPRVVDVFTNPNASKGNHLEVGIARPRAIYVLYPVKGREIFCRGAVLPYYEFTHDARLTDAEWKTLLDSDKRPNVPDWISPIIVPGGLSVPKLKSRE